MKSAYEQGQLKLSRKYEALQRKFKLAVQSGEDTSRIVVQIEAVSSEKKRMYEDFLAGKTAHASSAPKMGVLMPQGWRG